MTRKSSVILGLTLVAFMLETSGVNADDQEIEIALSDCPKAVQRTLKIESRGGQIEEIEREDEAGKMIFEAEVIVDEKEYEVEVAEDGTLLSKILEDEDAKYGDDEGDDEGDEEEVVVKISDCPKAVRKTLRRESRRGEIEEITKETEGKRTIYEAEVEIGDAEYEVEVAEDGTLLQKVLEIDEEDDDDDVDEEEINNEGEERDD